MAADKARISFHAARQYRKVVSQQGRVVLEADTNESQHLGSEETRLHAVDIVGPVGTPDDNDDYLVSLGAGGIQVHAGTMYVGGLRLRLESSVSYASQADWIDAAFDPLYVPPNAVGAGGHVLLHVREQEITAAEDPALRDVALGGPDSAARTRVQQRVLAVPTQASTCDAAQSALPGFWAQRGQDYLAATAELRSRSRLRVSLVTTTPSASPCDPPAQSGYLGADNQLIRVQVTSFNANTNTGTLVWGFNNASTLYRCRALDNTTLELATRPVSPEYTPRAGQAVQVLFATADMGDGAPGAALDKGAFVAALSGHVATLSAPYQADTRRVTLPAALPTEYRPGTTPDPRPASGMLFLRLWETSLNFTLGTAVELTGTGLAITLSTANGGPPHAGDYWSIAARPTTPNAVYPERYLTAAQPPDGPREWVCPLAVVRGATAAGPLVTDCRKPFPQLTELIDPGIRVEEVFTPVTGNAPITKLENDSAVQAQRIVQGVTFRCDGPIQAGTVSRPTCFATIELPFGLPSNTVNTPPPMYQELAIAAQVGVSNQAITWRPTASASSFLQQLPPPPEGDRGYLVRMRLKGNFIWSVDPNVFLDGETFGIRPANVNNTLLRLPSGDRRRGGEFLMWFWLTPRVRTPFVLSASAQPLTVRTEGLSEVTGDIVISGTGGVPTTAGQPMPLVNITVTLSAPITSARFNDNPGTMDAVLLVDDPAVLNGAKLVDPTPPVLAVDGDGQDFANGAAANIILGRRVNTNSVVFLGVPLDAPGTDAVRVIRIKNIRIAAAGVLAGNGQVFANISIQNPPADTQLNNPTVVVGFAQLGSQMRVRRADGSAGTFSFSAADGINRAVLRGPTNSADVNVNLQFNEGFASAYRVRGEGQKLPESLPGLKESAYTPGVGNLPVGFANSGTRFQARFSNVPQGVRLFVTTRDVPAQGVAAENPNSPPMDAVMIVESATGGGSATPPSTVPLGNGSKTRGTNVPIAEVVLTGGSGAAVWEWVSRADGNRSQNAVFGVVIAADPVQVRTTETVSVNLSLSPISTNNNAAMFGTAPVPRFSDTSSAEILFTRVRGEVAPG